MRLSTLRGVGLAAALAVIVAGCATTGGKPARTSEGPSPTTAPRALVAQASAFESYMRNARAIDAGFAGPAEVSRALQTGAANDPKELQAGMVAYAALAALQEPKFAAAVRNAPAATLRRMATDPQAAMSLPGADAAAARASGALYAQGASLNTEGQKVKKAAYSIQKQSWSKAKVPNAAGRLALVKKISAAGYQPAAGDAADLQTALRGSGSRSGGASVLVMQGLTLAALATSGQPARSPVSDPRTGMCLRMAKLNLYQCLASAGPHYEDVYCLGQHAMMETARCVTDATTPRRTQIASR